ncbi:MAG TPA: ABC transporter permease [Bryobacteraceae bacterium]|nr:ABC transporter permease [Bryobacteraceae bacterium]
MRWVTRLYGALARAFPHEFKVAYGADMIQLGEDIVEDIAKENGVSGLFRLLADLIIRVPIEYLSEIRRDLVYAVRALSKSRGFTAVGILSLGLGIGLAAVSVSEAMNLILRDAPGVRDADSVVMLGNVSYPYIDHYRDQHDLFAGAAAFQPAVPFNISVGNAASAKPERVFGQLVSPEYFSVLGVNAARGRVFSPDLDKPGSPPLVFITERFWREHMNSDPAAVGGTLRVNGQTATIVGIGPKDFQGAIPFITADIFVPTTVSASVAPELSGDVIHQRDAKSFSALLRMAPGVTLARAEAGLDTLTRNLDQETLDPLRNVKGRRVTLLPGGRVMPVPRSLVPVLLGFMVLLNSLIIGIVCMNLANMQLARATARRKEVAIRLSVGASRFRLVRQLLTESLLLALIGGVGGIALSFWAAAGVGKMKVPFTFPVRVDITPDWSVIAVVFAIAMLAGVGFGLAPALAATKTNLAAQLKEGLVGQARGYRRFGMRNLLMVGQVAGSLSLLLVTGFMIIGFSKSNHIDIGFDSASMYLFSLDPVRDGYSPERATDLLDGLTERLARAPGARTVVLSETAPYGPQAAVFTLSAPSGGGAPDQVVNAIAKNTVGPKYFESLSVPMLEGREFDIRDQRAEPGKGKPVPVVLNQTAARAFFGNAEPLGRRILDVSKSYEVVGVVQDLSAPLSQTGAGQGISVVPVVYLPLTRADFAHPPASGMIVMVRSDRGPDAIDSVRKELAAIDPNVAIFNVHTLAGQVADMLSYLRLSEFIYGGIGVFGLIVAAIGLAGVTAYSVARRRKEIGIRMALGARQSQVLGLVLREGASLVMIGSVVGLIVAIGLTRVLSAISTAFGPSFEAGGRDPRLLLGAPILLAGLAMLACYVPARRSAKIDPLIALREE